MKKRIKKCKTIVHAMHGIGSHRVPLPPAIASTLYDSVAIPKLMYGTDVMNLDDNTLAEMESFQFECAKLIQGIPKNSANVGGIVTLGWSTAQAKINTKVLQFLWRILLLPHSDIYKVVLINRFYEAYRCKGNISGPVANMVNLCKRYNVMGIVIKSIETGKFM